jgi:hypothetical protein
MKLGCLNHIGVATPSIADSIVHYRDVMVLALVPAKHYNEIVMLRIKPCKLNG